MRAGIRWDPYKEQRREADESEDGLCELDPGVADKRLLVRESELAKVLAAAGRDGSNLSATLRSAWDGEDLAEMTRKDPYRASDPHVVVQCDVTPAELLAMTTGLDRANGFLNRFLFVATRRAQSLPFGGDLRDDELHDTAGRLRDALAHARMIRRVGWTDAARPVWVAMYETAAAPDDDLGGVLARAAPHLLRLAMLYAVLDGDDAMDVCHLHAAAAVWDYCESSARWAFGSMPAEQPADPLADLLAWVVSRGGSATAAELSRSGPRLYRGRRDDADDALRRLAEAGHGDYQHDTTRPGRPSERFTIADRKTPGDAGYGNETPDSSAPQGVSYPYPPVPPPQTLSPPPKPIPEHVPNLDPEAELADLRNRGEWEIRDTADYDL